MRKKRFETKNFSCFLFLIKLHANLLKDLNFHLLKALEKFRLYYLNNMKLNLPVN